MVFIYTKVCMYKLYFSSSIPLKNILLILILLLTILIIIIMIMIMIIIIIILIIIIITSAFKQNY